MPGSGPHETMQNVDPPAVNFRRRNRQLFFVHNALAVVLSLTVLRWLAVNYVKGNEEATYIGILHVIATSSAVAANLYLHNVRGLEHATYVQAQTISCVYPIFCLRSLWQVISTSDAYSLGIARSQALETSLQTVSLGYGLLGIVMETVDMPVGWRRTAIGVQIFASMVSSVVIWMRTGHHEWLQAVLVSQVAPICIGVALVNLIEHLIIIPLVRQVRMESEPRQLSQGNDLANTTEDVDTLMDANQMSDSDNANIQSHASARQESVEAQLQATHRFHSNHGSAPSSINSYSDMAASDTSYSDIGVSDSSVCGSFVSHRGSFNARAHSGSGSMDHILGSGEGLGRQHLRCRNNASVGSCSSSIGTHHHANAATADLRNAERPSSLPFTPREAMPPATVTPPDPLHDEKLCAQLDQVNQYVSGHFWALSDLDDLEVHEFLGMGSFGTVHLCRTRCDNLVVAKDISLAKREIQQRKIDVMNEVTNQARLLHKHVVRLYGAYIIDANRDRPKQLRLVMEYADGGTLGDRIRVLRHGQEPQRFAIPVVEAWLAQLSSAIMHIHSKQVCPIALCNFEPSHPFSIDMMLMEPLAACCDRSSTAICRQLTSSSVPTATFSWVTSECRRVPTDPSAVWPMGWSLDPWPAPS